MTQREPIQPKIVITVRHEVDTNKTFVENIKEMLKQFQELGSLTLTVHHQEGQKSEHLVDEVFKASRARAYEQYFSESEGVELEAVGKLKPTDTSVVQQIKDYYSV